VLSRYRTASGSDRPANFVLIASTEKGPVATARGSVTPRHCTSATLSHRV